jgi:predicted nucleotidyltransferase
MNAPTEKIAKSIAAELGLITGAVVSRTPALAIYLFGSYAYGQPTADSDLDIYAVIPDSDRNITDLWAEIYGDLSDRKTLPLDLLIGKKSVFEERKNRLTLENVIANRGIKIYGN